MLSNNTEIAPGASTTDHGDPTPTVQTQLQRHDHIKILSQNVQGCSTEYSSWKRDSMAIAMQKHETDILCIQETNGHTDETLLIHDQLFFIHGLPNDSKIAREGVGIVLSSNAQKA